jgi:hypothetical protein
MGCYRPAKTFCHQSIDKGGKWVSLFGSSGDREGFSEVGVDFDLARATSVESLDEGGHRWGSSQVLKGPENSIMTDTIKGLLEII